MLLIKAARTGTIEDLRATLQKAVQLEFATLPPYLYAWYTVGDNAPARTRILDVVHEEMIHMMLVCNILNALGETPVIADTSVVPKFPGQLPFSIGKEDGKPFIVHLYPFGPDAMAQAAMIEHPENELDIPDLGSLEAATEYHTIGEFYAAVKEALPHDDAAYADVNQITSATAFPGELFKTTSRELAGKAIDHIVSQGEGTDQGTGATPLDFQGEVSHFYRFTEIERNQILQKEADAPFGYAWGLPLGIDFTKAVPAIANPAEHDFSNDPAAEQAQLRCDRAFSSMLVELQRAVGGQPDRLGNAVRFMFDLSQAAYAAISIELADKPGFVAGPAFRYRPELAHPHQG